MTFNAQTGGAPLGNKNGQKRGRWREALDKALKQYTNAHVEADPRFICQAGEALDKIAMTIVHRAVYGDLDAIDEVATRLDGKAAVAIIGGEDGDNPVRLVARIERVLIDPPSK